MIHRVIQHPFQVKPDKTWKRRHWHVGHFDGLLGYRGCDGAACYWLAVLMEENELITAYPIPHPKSLKSFR